MRNSIVLLMLLATPVSAQRGPSADGPITCTSPVSVDDSAKSLMQRYGEEAVVADDLYTGVEDITYRGVALLPQSPDWRIDVFFADPRCTIDGARCQDQSLERGWGDDRFDIGTGSEDQRQALSRHRDRLGFRRFRHQLEGRRVEPSAAGWMRNRGALRAGQGHQKRAHWQSSCIRQRYDAQMGPGGRTDRGSIPREIAAAVLTIGPHGSRRRANGRSHSHAPMGARLLTMSLQHEACCTPTMNTPSCCSSP